MEARILQLRNQLESVNNDLKWLVSLTGQMCKGTPAKAVSDEWERRMQYCEVESERILSDIQAELRGS